MKAQSAIGFELNINKDYLKLADPGQQLGYSKGRNASFNLAYKYIFRNNVFVNTGIGLKPYNEYLTFKTFFFSITSSANMAIQLPLLMGYRFPLMNETIYFSPFAGLAFNYLFFETGGSSSGIAINNSDTLVCFSNTTYPKTYFSTVTLGIMAEIMLGSRFSLALSTQFYKGFSTISTQNIIYSVNANPTTKASQTSNGTYLTIIGIKLNYHFKNRN